MSEKHSNNGCINQNRTHHIIHSDKIVGQWFKDEDDRSDYDEIFYILNKKWYIKGY